MSETKPRRYSMLLVVSLALNVFFVGTVVGGTLVGRSLHRVTGEKIHTPPIHSFASPRRILGEVNPEDRGALVKQVRKDMKAIRPLLRDVGQRRREAMDAMAAETFDEATVLKAFEALVAAESEAHSASNETLVAMLATLSFEERKRIVKSLHAGGKRRHRGEREGHEERRERWNKRALSEPEPEAED